MPKKHPCQIWWQKGQNCPFMGSPEHEGEERDRARKNERLVRALFDALIDETFTIAIQDRKLAEALRMMQNMQREAEREGAPLIQFPTVETPDEAEIVRPAAQKDSSSRRSPSLRDTASLVQTMYILRNLLRMGNNRHLNSSKVVNLAEMRASSQLSELTKSSFREGLKATGTEGMARPTGTTARPSGAGRGGFIVNAADRLKKDLSIGPKKKLRRGGNHSPFFTLPYI